MTAFVPTGSTIEPAAPPDELADAIVRSMGRGTIRHQPWGPIKAFLLGAISFGILPVLMWCRGFSQYTAMEQGQFRHLAEWLRRRNPDDPDTDLRPLLEDGPRSPFLDGALLLVLALITVWAAASIMVGVDLHHVWNVTYGFGRNLLAQPHRGMRSLGSDAGRLFAVWTISLSAAHLFLLSTVMARRHRLGKLMARFNMTLAREGLAEVIVPPLRAPSVLLWLLAGMAGVWLGAFWALPAALAGATLSGYAGFVSLETRHQVAMRVHQILSQQHGPAALRTPIQLRQRCPVALCGALLPPGAAYCPRCGESVAKRMDAVG